MIVKILQSINQINPEDCEEFRRYAADKLMKKFPSIKKKKKTQITRSLVILLVMLCKTVEVDRCVFGSLAWNSIREQSDKPTFIKRLSAVLKTRCLSKDESENEIFVMYNNVLCRIYLFVFGFCIVIYAKSIPTNWINLSADEINGLGFAEIDVNDPSRSNYTVEYVPLISIIAEYLPIFLRRLRTQEITTARSLNWLLTDEKICTLHHLGRFPNPDNHCQFFECAMNFKNLINCSQSTQHEGRRDSRITKHINDVIQLKSEKTAKKKHHTSLAVMYKVDECVSLILHQCSARHIYSNRLQRCIPHENAKCPDS